jgi:hypothetical protein
MQNRKIYFIIIIYCILNYQTLLDIIFSLVQPPILCYETVSFEFLNSLNIIAATIVYIK